MLTNMTKMVAMKIKDEFEEEACQLRLHLQQLSMHKHTSSYVHVWFDKNQKVSMVQHQQIWCMLSYMESYHM